MVATCVEKASPNFTTVPRASPNTVVVTPAAAARAKKASGFDVEITKRPGVSTSKSAGRAITEESKPTPVTLAISAMAPDESATGDVVHRREVTLVAGADPADFLGDKGRGLTE